MKYSHLALIVCTSLLAIACAQGDDGNNKNVPATGGSGGKVIGTGGSGGVINTGGTGGGSVSSECSASGYKDATCGACMEANCATACETCLNNTECSAWLDCVLACSDSACDDGCAQQHPTGEGPGLAWLGNSGCGSTACSSQCGSASSGCGLSTNGAAPACDTCITSYCCTQGSVCGNDQGCLDVLDCVNACASGDTACEDACVNANPTGASELNDFYGCLNQMCPNDC